jgi:nitrilase
MTALAQANFIVAVAQVAPVFLNRTATLERACQYIGEAGDHDASLVVLPASFIPAYPEWFWTRSPLAETEFQALYPQLLDEAIEIPGPVTQQLGQATRRARLYGVIGVTERRVEGAGVRLYNTLLYFDPMGNIVGRRRQLVLADQAGQVWAPGAGSTLEVYDTPFGKISGLIGPENFLTWARTALYAGGTQLYIATRWADGVAWLEWLRHIAQEGGVFVIGCGLALQQDDLPERFTLERQPLADKGGWLHSGDSVLVNPAGQIIAGPLHQQQGMLYGEIDPAQLGRPQARPALMQLTGAPQESQGHGL